MQVFLATFSLVTQYLVSCGSVIETMPCMFNLNIYTHIQTYFDYIKINVINLMKLVMIIA